MSAKGIAVAACLLAVSAGASVAETTLSVDPATVSPSSPEQWVLEGLRRAPGAAGGVDFVLDEARGMPGPGIDLLLGFDEASPVDATGRWSPRLASLPELAGESRSFMGRGAASFRSGDGPFLLDPRSSEVLGPGAAPGDFSISFWTWPAVAENGEILLRWRSVRREGSAGTVSVSPQSFVFSIVRDRPAWSFVDFFVPPAGSPGAPLRVELVGASIMVPRTWTHHLLRFDSSTGLVEYLMNGRVEATAYATPSGREAVPGTGAAGRTVYVPRVGEAAPIEIGPEYAGLVDEFSLAARFVEEADAARYRVSGGSAVSPVMDLGSARARLLEIGARRRTPGDSGASFMYRVAEGAYGWSASVPEWVPFDPDRPLPGEPEGRYVQLRVELYPDGRGEAGASFSGFELRYEPDLPPQPPARVLALAGDGAVTLRWTRVPEADVAGYAVWFGRKSGEYFGVSTTLGEGPFDAGRALEFTIDGLENGVIYYFAVASYDAAGPLGAGEFSVEASARPLRTAK
ncbi:MAG: fibronectin type III domain-containing protein [Spirochaetales bacterium]|nr:fibronectin type III domain-containing protein [Spirochaetales bacterium]